MNMHLISISTHFLWNCSRHYDTPARNILLVSLSDISRHTKVNLSCLFPEKCIGHVYWILLKCVLSYMFLHLKYEMDNLILHLKCVLDYLFITTPETWTGLIGKYNRLYVLITYWGYQTISFAFDIGRLLSGEYQRC